MKSKKITPVLSTLLMASVVLSPSVQAANVRAMINTDIGVEYITHIQDKGWETVWNRNGALSGTVGEGKRLEALKVELTGSIPDGATIETYVHAQNKGNLGPFSMGDLAGTQGEGLRMESIKLVLSNLPGYRLKYNVQVQNKGWLGDVNDSSTWFSSGEWAGTAGEGLRLEGLMIKVIAVNEAYETYLATLAAVSESAYTPESWAVYKTVVDANVVTESDTSEAIMIATNNIIEAQKSLVRGKNLVAYNTALKAVNEVDYTPDTWAAYLVVVNDNVVTMSNTQTEIDTAVENILSAQKQLQFKVNLTDYKATLDAVREADYTATSWAEYQKVVAANAMTEDNSQAEIQAAINIISQAQKKMVRKFDFTAYNALLAAVKEADYIESSWAVYQTVVNANVVTESDTQTDIETAIKNIEEAQSKLVKKADLTYYNAVLNAVKKDDYTTASWTAYQKVVQSYVVNSTSTEETVNASITKILEAQMSLVPAGDLRYYAAALAAVTRSNYTSASWATYQKVLDANKVIATDGQTAIDDATQKIVDAQKKLVKAGDLTAYNAMLAIPKEANYTSTSWVTYQKVVKANSMTADKGQDAIDAATEKIRLAQESLVLKGKLDLTNGYNATLALAKEINYTPASWAVYQKVLDANEMTTDKSQAEIDSAVAKIVSAQKKLIPRAGADALAAYQTLLAKVKEDDYTVASWTVYKKVLAANVMTKEKSQAEIDKAILNIQAAQDNLVKKGVLTEYTVVFNAYNGRQDDFKTKAWSDYQKVLDANIMTTENTQVQIDTAVAKIKRAETALLANPAAIMTFYNEVLKTTDGKQAEFTAESWKTYQAVVVKNARTKDNTQEEVNAAANAILEAQSKLVRANADELKAFQETLELYQENIIKPGTIEALATPASWLAYKNIVELNASFDSSGNWVPTVITAESSKATIAKATAEIDAVIRQLQSRTLDFSAYDALKAAIPWDGSVAEKYTKSSYEEYVSFCQSNEIRIRILSSQDKINNAVALIGAAQSSSMLKPRATADQVAAFEAEFALFRTLTKADYTPNSWTAYEKAYTKYSLKSDENSQDEYVAATADLKGAREALVKTATYVVNNGALTADKIGALAVDDNILTKAKAYLAAYGYNDATHTITFTKTAGTADIGSDGKINDKGDGATVTFTISTKDTSAPSKTTGTIVLTIN